MNEFIEIKKDEQEINLMPPLTWAYVGDCVYELYIRTKLVNETKLKPHALHIEAIKHVKAKAQAETLKNIYEDYIHKILDAKDDYAFIVKQADMKDHMTLTDTLTEKLRDKYIPVLHYFL